MKALSAFLLVASALLAQSGLGPPQLGFIQDGHRRFRPVNGVAANFLLGRAVLGRVVSAAFSGSYGLIKSDSGIIVTDREGRVTSSDAAPPGFALFAFSKDGVPALAYFQHTNELRVWDGNKFRAGELVRISSGVNAVLAIAALDSTHAALIIERDDGLWELRVRTATGAVASYSFLPRVSAPALLLPSGELVYRNARGVVVRRQDGSEKHIAAHLPDSLAFGQMGDDWVQITDLATGRLFAVTIQPGRERYYILPEARR